MEIVTHSAAETKKFAHEFAKNLKGGEILALYGDLGAGKTTFTQGVALALGIKQRIVSPTFVIHKKYPVGAIHESPKNIGANSQRDLLSGRDSPLQGNRKWLNHLDCYRLEGLPDLKTFDLDELFCDPNAVTIIEWPERIEELLPNKIVKITFETLSESERKITITS